MTPANTRVSNYGIDDLSAGDSTDEEDCPKKSIPAWAKMDYLRLLMSCQEEGRVKPCLIFPAVELMREVDLARIFKVKHKRFFHRSSSAKWDSPALLKKGKFETCLSKLALFISLVRFYNNFVYTWRMYYLLYKICFTWD